MATQLVSAQHEANQRKLAELVAQLDEMKADLASFTPQEPAGAGTVIRFTRFRSAYTYAAIRVFDEWYLTQNPTRTQDRRYPKSWSELLNFIGEANYGSIEVLG